MPFRAIDTRITMIFNENSSISPRLLIRNFSTDGQQQKSKEEHRVVLENFLISKRCKKDRGRATTVGRWKRKRKRERKEEEEEEEEEGEKKRGKDQRWRRRGERGWSKIEERTPLGKGSFVHGKREPGRGSYK